MNHSVYLVLGASSEVGMAFIKMLEQKNTECVVIAQYHTMTEAFRVVLEYCKTVSVKSVSCDLADEAQTTQLIEDIKEIAVPTHILHCAAKPFEYKRLKETDWHQVMEGLNIQVGSVMNLCKAFLPLMAKKRYGKIVFMLSSCTIGIPPKYMTEYTIVKYALLGFMKSIACEYAGKGITINGISPSMMRTKFLRSMDERMIDMLEEKHPMKRMITIEEVVKNIDFLLSDQSDFMTGENLNLSGGQVM